LSHRFNMATDLLPTGRFSYFIIPIITMIVITCYNSYISHYIIMVDIVYIS
jgi:hypothetical protein